VNIGVDVLFVREDDTKKMNEQAEQLQIIESNYQGLKVLMQSYQEGRADLETEVRWVLSYHH
jgi:hypothetical protein